VTRVMRSGSPYRRQTWKNHEVKFIIMKKKIKTKIKFDIKTKWNKNNKGLHWKKTNQEKNKKYENSNKKNKDQIG